jgi:hypothetical protein
MISLTTQKKYFAKKWGIEKPLFRAQQVRKFFIRYAEIEWKGPYQYSFLI